jgi:hypothetical protein
LLESYHLLLILTVNNGKALMADVMHLLDDCWGVDMNDGLETCSVDIGLVESPFQHTCL